ncbi:MAG: hypothetical protein AAFQ63_19930 [Cyanobacteria bacterium J06621_11]
MHLIFYDHTVEIQLEQTEKLWAFHLSGRIIVPLKCIQSVTPERPNTTWKELRSPGTYLPSIIKAGTYYTKRGREFWYVQGDSPCLCIDISEGYYKRIVLGSEAAERWHSQIQTRLSNPIQAALPN